jgi:hypothetical protein
MELSGWTVKTEHIFPLQQSRTTRRWTYLHQTLVQHHYNHSQQLSSTILAYASLILCLFDSSTQDPRLTSALKDNNRLLFSSNPFSQVRTERHELVSWTLHVSHAVLSFLASLWTPSFPPPLPRPIAVRQQQCGKIRGQASGETAIHSW